MKVQETYYISALIFAGILLVSGVLVSLGGYGHGMMGYRYGMMSGYGLFGALGIVCMLLIVLALTFLVLWLFKHIQKNGSGR